MIHLLLALACAPPEPPEPPEPPSAVEAQAPAAEISEVPAPEPEPRDPRRPPPDGFVDLEAHIPGLRVDIRYHTADNFTGAPLPGYGAPGAWLLREVADALGAVQTDLQATGHGLLVYDAYRPLRGTLAMVAWARRTGQEHLLDDGYIARRSKHNQGTTVDLTVVDLETGAPLDMGTPWDTLTAAAHTRNATGRVLENRLLLKGAMERHGFRHYSKEWWHFRFAVEQDEPLPHRDVPYACFEPDEGTWTAPDGWDRPGFVMPAAIEPGPCPGAAYPMK